MWSLSQLLTFLQKFCVDESITQAELIEFIKLRYAKIFNRALDFYKTETTFATVASTKFYYLDPELNVSLGVKFFNQTDLNNPIQVKDRNYIYERDPDESETGSPRVSAYIELSHVKRQPNESSDAGTVGVKSTSASDTGKAVTISGLRTVSSQVIEDSEEISTTGTAFAAATKTGWHTFRVISKEEDTAGAIIVSDTDGGNVYAVINPYGRRAQYQKWRLWPTPDSVATIKVTGHRKPIVPQEDSATLDVPSDIEAACVHGLRADIHDVNFDMIKAQKYDALFEEGLQMAMENSMWADGQDLVEGSEGRRRYDPLADLEDVDEDIEVL
jgi:hypothetical protein